MANLFKELSEVYRSDYESAMELFAKPLRTKPIVWRDRVFFPGFEPEAIEYALDKHEPGENEIMIVSYAKTGTTWTREIVRQILYGKDEKLNLITQDLTPAIIYLETAHAGKYNVLDNLPIPRKYYVTHLPAELVNVEKYKSKNMKFIYTIRNPKDQMVSMFHFLREYMMTVNNPLFDPNDWNSFFQASVEGRLPTNMKEGEGYLDHILSWFPHIINNDNAMILVYEEMIKNPKKEVKRIAGFIGVNLTDEGIFGICEKTSFAAMKKSDSESTSEESKSRNSLNMLRKGGIGDWKNYFTLEQSARVDDDVKRKLEETGIKFIYE